MKRMMLIFTGFFTVIIGFFFQGIAPIWLQRTIIGGIEGWVSFLILIIGIGAISLFAVVLLEALVFGCIEEAKIRKRILKKIYSKKPQVQEYAIMNALSMENPSKEILEAVIDNTACGTPENNQTLDIILEKKKSQKKQRINLCFYFLKKARVFCKTRVY